MRITIYVLPSHVEDRDNPIVGGSSSAAIRNTYTGLIWMCRTRTILGPFVCAQHSVVLQLDAARAVHQDPKARRGPTTRQTTE